MPWESINWSFAEVIGLRYEYHTSNVSVKLKIHITPTVYVTETTEVQALKNTEGPVENTLNSDNKLN